MIVQSHLLRVYGDTDFITGLRAIAATMVVMIHTGALAGFGTTGQAITDAGKYGVDIFFVISGFTIAKTFTDARDYQSYLTRRIIRIVPLYWFITTIAIILWASGQFSLPYWMQELGSKPDLYNYLMHLSMVSYLDYRVANSILGVEWSIPVEVFWYVCLPLLLYFARTIRRAVGMIIVLLIVTGILSYFLKMMFGTSLPAKWFPIGYGHLFLVGAASYYLRERFQSVTNPAMKIWILAAVGLFFLALLVDFSGRSEIIAICTAILIVCVTPARASLLTKLLTTKPMLFLGTISYSIYLIHAVVIHILIDAALLPASGVYTFLVVYGVTVLLSTATYLAVERPTNHAGRRLVENAQ